MARVFFVILTKDGVPQETRIFKEDENRADSMIYSFYLNKYALQRDWRGNREINSDTTKYNSIGWEIKKVVKDIRSKSNG